MQNIRFLMPLLAVISCWSAPQSFAQYDPQYEPRYGNPPAMQCLDGMRRIAPEYREDDRRWVCGLSNNSPVQGYGNRQDYVSCLLDTMEADYTNKNRAEFVMRQCAAHSYDRYDYTLNMPVAVYCMSQLNYMNPAFDEPGLQWLCGLSNNSPVKGYGERYDYVSCVVDAINMDRANANRGDLVATKCAYNIGMARGPETEYMPSALYCVSELRELFPGIFREEDARWACGVTTNARYVGYGDKTIYSQCVVNTFRMRPDLASNSTVVLDGCARQADTGTMTYPRPGRRRDHGPIVIPNRGTATPPHRTTMTCPQGYRWDANRQQCVVNDVRRGGDPVPMPRVPTPAPGRVEPAPRGPHGTCPQGYRWDANRQQCVMNDVRRSGGR